MPSAPPHPSLAERVANAVNHLILTICHLYVGGPQGGRIPRALMPLIQRRINEIQFRFTHLAGRIATGTYKLRRGSPRRGTIAAKPRPDSPFRKQGWLAELLPPSIAAPLRGGLRSLLNNPEMVALKYKARPRPQPRPAAPPPAGRPAERPTPPSPAAKAGRGGGFRRPGR